MAVTPPAADVAIRSFAAGDRDAAVALLDSDPWRRLGFTRADWLRLLETPLEGREGFVAVAAAARGRGLGAALLAHLETVVFARARNFFVCVSDFNDGARRFYSRHGYAHVGTLPDLLVRGSAELLLRKSSGPVRDHA